MPTTKELLKENTELIQKNYDYTKRIHALEIRLTNCEDTVTKLCERVLSLESKIEEMQTIINVQQREIVDLQLMTRNQQQEIVTLRKQVNDLIGLGKKK